MQDSGEIKVVPISCLPVQIELHRYRGLKRCRALAPAGRLSSQPHLLSQRRNSGAELRCRPRNQTLRQPAQPVLITLEEALKRAQSSEPTYATALADSKVAGLDRSIARAGLLPSASLSQPGASTHNRTDCMPKAGRRDHAQSQVRLQRRKTSGVHLPGHG